MQTIKLTCNWCDDETLYNRFVSTYVSSSNFNSNIQFTNSSRYDWLVIVNYPHYYIDFPKERTLGVIMEPSWTKHYENKHVLERLCNHIFYHKKQIDNSQYIFYPGLLPYHFDHKNGDTLDYFINTTFTKTKKCSMVVSYIETSSHENCIYRQRTNFAKQILQTDLDVDIYGNNWDRAGIEDQRIKGPIANKKNALVDYEFSVAIENCVEQGYFTEKIADCILTNTTPIYYGCPDITCFIPDIYRLTELNNLQELMVALQSGPLKQNKEKFATKYNLYKALTNYIIALS